MISVQNLFVEFQANPLFNNVSFVVNPRDKIALVGKNGAGKSTLLKIIAGLQSPTSGNISTPEDVTIGYLPQHMVTDDTTTLIEETQKAFSHIKEMQRQLDAATEELSYRQDYESDDYQKLIDHVTYLNEQLSYAEGENGIAEIEKTLLGLGFNRGDFNRLTSEFSGGWRMRIELAKILLRKPDVLLLDEPTNHLDIESIQWLEEFLITKAKAVVLVSHDRAFLDNVTKRTIELSLGRIYDYKVPYTQFMELRKERMAQQIRAYQNQQKQIADTEDFIERFRYKATKSVQVQSRIKQLAKIERIEVEQEDMSRLNLRFPPAPRSGDYPVTAENVGKYYGEHKVFDGATFTIKRGEKIAFVGKNGEGKSTLVKCIMGELQHSGYLKLGHNVKIGYFAQNQAALLDGELTVFDTIDHVAVGDIRTKIRDILGAFMFGGEESDKKVKVLSGGERTRLAMIKLLLEPVNLLILDEPTNHLDIKTKDILKQAISDFDGTVIVVSHDRDFLNGLVDKVYEFGGGKVLEHLGGIYDFLDKKRMQSLHELEVPKSTPIKINSQAKTAVQSAKENASSTPVAPKANYAQQREFDKMTRRFTKSIEKYEQEISRIEDEIQSLEQTMSTGTYSDEIIAKHTALSRELDTAMSLWELSNMELEEFKKKHP